MNVKLYNILIPVWGEVYVNRFMKYCLPSLMSKNNMSTLDGEICISFLTEKNSINLIKNNINYKLISDLNNEFIEIDDLIYKNLYGYTLTMSYYRGIQNKYDHDKETIFIFLNADFIMSDGTMKNIVGSINAGYSGIMAPSLRCNAEDIEHELKNDFESGLEFHEIYNSRKLVRNTFLNLHPTVYSNFIDNKYVSISIVNQFYYQVNDNLLLARNLLLFMLAIKPTRVPDKPSCFCDYSFISDLCPEAMIKYFDDSDVCFLMELQDKEKELEYINFDKKDLNNISRQIKIWATEQHYNNFNTIIKYHTGDIDKDNINNNIKAFNNKLSVLISEIENTKPVSHIDHPYWLGTLSVLNSAPIDESRSLFKKLFASIKRISIKDIFNVSLIHYDYGEYRFINTVLNTIKGDNKKAVVITNIKNNLLRSSNKNANYDIIEMSTRDDYWENNQLFAYEQLIIYLDEPSSSYIREVFGRIKQLQNKYNNNIILIIKGSISDIYIKSITGKLIDSMDLITELSDNIKYIYAYGSLYRNLFKYLLLCEVDYFYREKKYITLFNVLLIQSIIVMNNILGIFRDVNNIPNNQRNNSTYVILFNKD